MKVLIAEDDPASSLILRTTLRKLGHEVLAAENGMEALAHYQTENIHLIISDWMMPEMDGLELCRRVRSEQRVKYTYFILLTALTGKEHFLEGMEAGADDFLNKPFDRETLQARLRVAERILSLQAEVKALEGLLPVCSYCKRIRDDARTEWVPMEQYINERTDASFSHGICPDCRQQVQVEIQEWAKEHGSPEPTAEE